MATLQRDAFPRSNGWDFDWVMEHQMGPNPIWLAEWLASEMDLRPGMRILDLGCGTALTSIFLAREFDLQVWAADLWVNPDDNWGRVREIGEEARVFPMSMEAHALPFAAGFFDAVVSMDAYQYFGTDVLYLKHLSRIVKPGGEIGIVMPGLTREIPDGPPAALTEPQSNGTPFWEEDCASFRTAAWWRDHWRNTSRVSLKVADTLADGWRLWRDFEAALEAAGRNRFPSVAEAIDKDAGETLGFVRLVGQVSDAAPDLDLYRPSLLDLVDG